VSTKTGEPINHRARRFEIFDSGFRVLQGRTFLKETGHATDDPLLGQGGVAEGWGGWEPRITIDRRSQVFRSRQPINHRARPFEIFDFGFRVLQERTFLKETGHATDGPLLSQGGVAEGRGGWGPRITIDRPFNHATPVIDRTTE
jgi:hypothetical protein